VNDFLPIAVAASSPGFVWWVLPR